MHKVQHEVFQLIDPSLRVPHCTWPGCSHPILGGMAIDTERRITLRGRTNREIARSTESSAVAVAARLNAVASYPSRRLTLRVVSYVRKATYVQEVPYCIKTCKSASIYDVVVLIECDYLPGAAVFSLVCSRTQYIVSYEYIENQEDEVWGRIMSGAVCMALHCK